MQIVLAFVGVAFAHEAIIANAPLAYSTYLEPRSSYEYSSSVQTADYANYASVKSEDPALRIATAPATIAVQPQLVRYAQSPIYAQAAPIEASFYKTHQAPIVSHVAYAAQPQIIHEVPSAVELKTVEPVQEIQAVETPVAAPQVYTTTQEWAVPQRVYSVASPQVYSAAPQQVYAAAAPQEWTSSHLVAAPQVYAAAAQHVVAAAPLWSQEYAHHAVHPVALPKIHVHEPIVKTVEAVAVAAPVQVVAHEEQTAEVQADLASPAIVQTYEGKPTQFYRPDYCSMRKRFIHVCTVRTRA